MEPATIATVIKSARVVVKYGAQVFEYIRDDQTAKLGLLAPVKMIIEGPGVGIANFKAPDGTFELLSPTINRAELTFHPFAADAKSWWNGPDIISNRKRGGRIPGSLAHDALAHFRDAIAKQAGLPVNEVWEWAAGMLAAVWRHYGGHDTRAEGESRAAYYIVKPARRAYERVKRLLGFSAILLVSAMLTGCAGCIRPVPDWRVIHADPVIWQEGISIATNTPPPTFSTPEP